jgi:hypothetical protein
MIEFPFSIRCRCGQTLMEHRGVRFPMPVIREATFTCGSCGETITWLTADGTQSGPVAIGTGPYIEAKP